VCNFYPCHKNYDQIRECFPLLRKALPGLFLRIFSSITYPQKPGFSKRDLLLWKVPTSQALLGSSDQWKVPASLSLFLKSEKIPALLYVGKGHEYRPFRDFRRLPALGTDLWAQISNHQKGLSDPSPIQKSPAINLLSIFRVSLS
jgi:hypothetical protein